MKTTLITIGALSIIFLSSYLFAGGDFDHDKEPSSDVEGFHSSVHFHPESYLVCIYDTEKKKHAPGYPEQFVFKSTIVDVIKGNKNVGENLIFERIYDSKVESIMSHLEGKLYYIFLYANDKGSNSVNSQDPAAMQKYKKAYQFIAKEHKIKG